ncbi:30-kDa cleavage and polyadenylation specificity factor 30-like protein [Tanacetum coccineum]
MEEEIGEGGLNFDFETGLDTLPTQPTASVPVINQPQQQTTHQQQQQPPQENSNFQVGGGGRRSYRQTVCRHWLRSLCMKGEACGFLHQYDKTRMPICTSWDFVQMVLTVGTDMQNFRDPLLRWKKYSRRFNN